MKNGLVIFIVVVISFGLGFLQGYPKPNNKEQEIREQTRLVMDICMLTDMQQNGSINVARVDSFYNAGNLK